MLLQIPQPKYERILQPSPVETIGHRSAYKESVEQGRAYNPNRFLVCENNSAIERMIKQKLLSEESIEPSPEQIMSVVTDADHFPYTRFYRGIYNSEIPTVWSRSAGYRARCDSCYESRNIQVPPSGETRSYYSIYR